jgi:hypothetical protein
MVMGDAFCLTATFVLAKFVRDNEVRTVDPPRWRFLV